MALRLSEGLGSTAQPLLAGDLVQAVRTEGMTFRDCRMLKVCLGVDQTDALHDLDRRPVRERCERDDFFEVQLLNADPETLLRALGSEALTPG